MKKALCQGVANYVCACLGEFLGLTGARLNGAELVASGLATHFVPSEVRSTFTYV